MQVDGRGAPGFVKATGHLKLAGSGEQTAVTYEGDARVGGRLASVGQRLVESSAKAIIKQSLDGLNEAVKTRGGGDSAEGAPAPARTAAPSQTEFAASIAKEVAKDMLPPWLRYGAVAVVLAIILYVLYTLLA
jgi:hypothetical protein